MRGTLPQGVIGPVFNDDFGDVYGSIYALSADGFSDEELREHADDVRQRLLRVPDVAKVEIFGAQAEKLFVEISHKRLAQLGLDLNQVIAQLGAQNAVEGARRAQRRPARTSRCASAASSTRSTSCKRFPIRAVNPATGLASTLRLGDIAEIRRGTVDPPEVKVRHQGKAGDRARHLDGQGRRHHRARRGAEAARSTRSEADLPAGIEMRQVQDQPNAVSRSVGEFVRVLLEAVVVVLAVSFISLGLHTKPLRIDIWPGPGGGHHDPAGAGDHLRDDVLLGRRPAQDLARLADHRARPARRRRDHRGRDDGAQARGGLRQGARRDLRLRGDGDADAHRHADHRGRLPADRPGAVDGRRIHLRDLRRHRGGAGDLVAVSVYFVPYLGAVLLRDARRAAPTASRARAVRHAVLRRAFGASSNWCVRAPLDHDRA